MNTHNICNFFVILLTFLSPLIHAQISHEGVMGAPFYGITRDSSLSVVNQVGPYADFAVPTKLNAKTDATSLISGEFTKLQASLSFDDGTITTLSPSKVFWSSPSKDLIIKDGFVTADKISKNARVSISANADGFSAILYIRLKAGALTSDSISDTSKSFENLLSDSIDLPQPGWKQSGWLGNYYEGGNNWIHHQHHGWLYTTTANEPSSLWLWSPSQKWLWTGPGIYPHMFRNLDGAWMYFVVQALPQKVYYNQSTKTLERAE